MQSPISGRPVSQRDKKQIARLEGVIKDMKEKVREEKRRTKEVAKLLDRERVEHGHKIGIIKKLREKQFLRSDLLRKNRLLETEARDAEAACLNYRCELTRLTLKLKTAEERLKVRKEEKDNWNPKGNEGSPAD